jgi:ABC-type amino acid transport system permease subunit
LVKVFAVAEVVRATIEHFPTEWIMVARVCGLSKIQAIRYISLPLVLRQITPALLTLAVAALQNTLFASLISVNEVFRVSQRINAEIYQPVQVYTALAVVFLAICLPLHGLASILRHRFSRDLSER